MQYGSSLHDSTKPEQVKGKAIPLQALRLPDVKIIGHMKVVRLSALRTGRLYPQELFLVLISVSD